MNILSKFQLSSSSGLGLTVLWIYFHKPSANQLINELINDEAVYRTAPATPGLLITNQIAHYAFDISGNWQQFSAYIVKVH